MLARHLPLPLLWHLRPPFCDTNIVIIKIITIIINIIIIMIAIIVIMIVIAIIIIVTMNLASHLATKWKGLIGNKTKVN